VDPVAAAMVGRTGRQRRVGDRGGGNMDPMVVVMVGKVVAWTRRRRRRCEKIWQPDGV
jgi:hypothetical protein